MPWEEASADFQTFEGVAWNPEDGMWDFYASFWLINVPDTSIQDWEVFYRFVLATYPHEGMYALAGKPLPATAAGVFAVKGTGEDEVMVGIQIDVGDLRLSCLFHRNEIELMFDAHQTTNEQGFNRLVAFMKEVGLLLGKQIAVSLEDEPDDQLLLYEPVQQKVRWLGRRRS